MRNAGIMIGSAIRDYRETRDRRRRSEEFDELAEHRAWEREREKALAGELDPMRVEGAELELSGARRRDQYEGFADPYARKDIQRRDRMGAMNEDLAEHTLPYEKSRVEREHRSGQRAEQYEQAVQPLNIRGAQREDQLGGFAVEQATAQNDASRYYRSARNALSNFSMTGNPMYLEDFYNEMIPDGGEAKITKLGDDKYRLTHSNGRSVETTKDELLKKSEQFFFQNPTLDDFQPPQQRDTRNQSAYIQQVQDITDTLIAAGTHNPIEARMEAHARASSRAQTNPREAAANFYQDAIDKLLPSSTYRSPSDKDVERAQQKAAEMTREFMDRYYGGGGQSAVRGSGVDTSQIPEGFRERLMQNPTEAAKYHFDRRFGEGAADAVLAEQR